MATSIVHSIKAVTGPLTSPTFVTSGTVTYTDNNTASYSVADGVAVVRVNCCVPVKVTLPTTSAANAGRFLTVTNVGNGGVVVDGNTFLVCGLAQIVLLEQNDSITLVCDGTTGWDGTDVDKDSVERWTNFCTLFRFSTALATKQQSPNAATPIKEYNKMKLPNQLPVYTYRLETLNTAYRSSQSTHTSLGNMLVLPNKKILTLNDGTTNSVNVYDPVTNTDTNIDTGTDTTFDIPWSGSVLLPNGYVCLIPSKRTTIGLFKPPYASTNDYLDGPAHGASVLSTYRAFKGGALIRSAAGHWMVVMGPYSAGVVGLYFPDVAGGGAGAYRAGPSIGANYTPFRYTGVTVAVNGKVIFSNAPWGAFGIYDPAGSGTVDATYGNLNTVMALDASIVSIVSGAINKYDAITNTAASTGITVSDGSSTPTMCMLPNGHVVIISLNRIIIWDPINNTTSQIESANIGTTLNTGISGCVLPDGRFMFYNGNTLYALHTGMTWPTALCTHTQFNKY
jgi:hypothetical protein